MSSLNATPLKDETPSAQETSKDKEMRKNKKSLEEGKMLRRKLRHLRHEDEQQARSLAQDLKDIRESLRDVNNVRQPRDSSDGTESSTRRERMKKKGSETEDISENFPTNSETRVRRGSAKHEVTTTDANRCDDLEENPNNSRKAKQTSPSQKISKTVRFEDTEFPRNTKPSDAPLTLSTIKLE